MDFERLERAWNSPANSPSAAASADVVEEMMHTLKKRRDEAAGLARVVGLVLVLWTLKIGYDVVFDPFPFDIRREWSVIPLFALPWIGLILVQLQLRRHRLAHPDPYGSVPATLRALLDENRPARRTFVIATSLMGLGVVGVAFALYQLMLVGKMTPANVLQASILFGAIMLSVAAYKAWQYLRVLKPETARLERLLAQYSEA